MPLPLVSTFLQIWTGDTIKNAFEISDKSPCKTNTTYKNQGSSI